MTSLRCFLWDELGNLAAYCPYLEIGEPPVVADASATEMHSVQGKIPYSVEYEKTASRVRIRGAAADGEYVVLQVLKAGGDFQTTPQEEDVLYHNQATAVDGAFAFEIEFDDSSEGAHEAVLASNGAAERTFLSLTLVTPEHFQELYSALNTAAAEDDDKEFERLINENLENLNFHFALTEEKNLSAELADYRAYVKNHPLDTNQAEQNCQIFKTYMMAYALNHQDISNIDTSVDQLYFADSSLLTQYHKLAPDAVVQRYFTKKMYDNTINNLEEFEIAFKRALIFTGVRYGDGYGDVREVLTAYGDVIGITDSASDKVYSGLLGNDYGSEAALTAAYRALQSGSGSGTGSANNSTNGYKGSGGGSYGSTSGGYSVENTPGQKEPEQLKVRFWDIEGVDWAAEAILALADQGIIHGTEPGMFEPDKAVTREEFIKILVGAMGLANAEYSHNAFIDVPEDAWYSSYVNIAQENGIVQGIGGGIFGVGQTITREDMVTMIYHALKLRNVALSSGVPNFADASDISDYACTAVSALCELGAVNGVTAAEFQPRGSATRAQAAKVIYSVLGYLQ